MAAKSFLFVYGTLKSTSAGGMGRSQRARLASESLALGGARVAGRLYDLGSYPALMIDSETGMEATQVQHVSDCARRIGRTKTGRLIKNKAQGYVSGEVFQIQNAQKTFAWLDAYEGFRVETSKDQYLYQRMRVQVQLDTGQLLYAWLYVVLEPIKGAREIPDGDWYSGDKLRVKQKRL